MESIEEKLKMLQEKNGVMLAHIYKSYQSMNENERKQFTQTRCDAYNSMNGNLNEKDGYDCPKCLNKGYISIVQETIREESTNDYTEALKKCTCWSVRAAIMRMKNSGLENVMQRYTFDRFETTETWQSHVKNTALRFIEEKGNVFFIGGCSGSGKTHICTAITGQFLRQGKAAHYMLWQEEVLKLKACVMDSDEYQEQMQRLKSIDVLYIDDFFKPVGNQDKPSTADVRIAYELINHRYNNKGLITIISSERLIGEVLDIDEATGGRLVEYAGNYMLNIQRDKKRNYRLRNIQEV